MREIVASLAQQQDYIIQVVVRLYLETGSCAGRRHSYGLHHSQGDERFI
jgi:hypothetical protein